MASKRQRRELRRLSENVQLRVNLPPCVEGRRSDYEFEDEVEAPLPRYSSAALFAEAERQSESPLRTAVEELAAKS